VFSRAHKCHTLNWTTGCQTYQTRWRLRRPAFSIPDDGRIFVQLWGLFKSRQVPSVCGLSFLRLREQLLDFIHDAIHLSYESCFALGRSRLRFSARQKRRPVRRRRNSSHPKRLERPKVTAVVDAEIRVSARWRALPPRHYSAPHYAGRRRGAGPDSCRPLRSVCWQVPL
jgi:hypothetical protein